MLWVQCFNGGCSVFTLGANKYLKNHENHTHTACKIVEIFTANSERWQRKYYNLPVSMNIIFYHLTAKLQMFSSYSNRPACGVRSNYNSKCFLGKEKDQIKSAIFKYLQLLLCCLWVVGRVDEKWDERYFKVWLIWFWMFLTKLECRTNMARCSSFNDHLSLFCSEIGAITMLHQIHKLYGYCPTLAIVRCSIVNVQSFFFMLWFHITQIV